MGLLIGLLNAPSEDFIVLGAKEGVSGARGPYRERAEVSTTDVGNGN